jgi:signal transduction histidine kinase
VAKPNAEPSGRGLLPPAVQALDEAVRGISGVLDREQVLQLIVDRVRALVHAEYAALGIVDDEGRITQFLTSGISAEDRAAIGELPHGHGLLGLIIRENRSYRVPSIAAHPESYGFPPNHPVMESFLGVPVGIKGSAIGRLYLTEKQDAAEFSAEDQALVETFALHAGIAIENARLHDEVQRLAIVDERDRISRDLHDSVIQMIYAVTLSLDDIPDLVASDPDEARRRADHAVDALNGVIREIRQFIFGLRPVLLDSGTLTDGLVALADELQRNTATQIGIETDVPDDLPLTLVADLLSVAREALANVARHASAAHAQIHATAADGKIRLEIADDGRGMPPTVRNQQHGHNGLANMRARAEGRGGTFEVVSAPEAGTRIVVTVPLSGR